MGFNSKIIIIGSIWRGISGINETQITLKHCSQMKVVKTDVKSNIFSKSELESTQEECLDSIKKNSEKLKAYIKKGLFLLKIIVEILKENSYKISKIFIF